ncbi:MAG: HAD-IIA family hydrolase [Alicyclobacillus macrosporangiidus]|uniref:HAD-IIA family hydrolase n=1 Tax=Alicyclobacillus TaxID=29330 RepID=UPI0004086366|nr:MULTISPECIES: HAD-IIA family hydrolase [Alicyclobacillus]MCL6597880.1 HAD-IIA family hydrolase [Alicyclobacillus macrosporangiidus]
MPTKLLEHAWQAALIDLDGTLYRGDAVIPGAAEFVQRLRDRGIQPVFLTNNSVRTPRQTAEKLKGMGIGAHAEEVVTSSEASAAFVKRRIGKGRVGFLGAAGVTEALEAVGLVAVGLRGWPETQLPQVDALVLGLDTQARYLDYAAFAMLAMDLGWFVLTNPDVRLPVGHGFYPGNGAVGRLIAEASGVEPVVVGKPAPEFIDYALSRYGLSRSATFIVGDNLRTDIAAGRACGLTTVWVQSGVQYPADEMDVYPEYTFPSVAEID